MVRSHKVSRRPTTTSTRRSSVRAARLHCPGALLLTLILLAGALLQPAEAFLFVEYFFDILLEICNIPIIRLLLPFCSKIGCGGPDDSIVCLPGVEFCDKPVNTCSDDDDDDGQPGFCVEVPQFCNFIYEPVCGCDGVTYANDCARRTARVSKAKNGPCGDACGGTEGNNDAVNNDCPAANEFCDRGSCTANNAMGECVLVPDACPAVSAPVCGCDDTTYSNDCVRRSARVSKASDGPCTLTCGGVDNTNCSENEFCDIETGKCGDPNAGGECVVVVQEDCDALFEPVCGCDGTTYSNDCERLNARVSKESNGPCSPICGPGAESSICVGDPCDSSDSASCFGDILFCELPSNNCNISIGQCVEIPDACPEILDPTCGCDGVSYSNDCLRLQAGVSKAEDGEC